MGLATALFNRLTTDPAVSGLVGNRVYPQTSPENIYPLISFDYDRTKDDVLGTPTGGFYAVTLSCMALDSDVAESVANATLAALDRQGWAASGVTVKSCIFESASQNHYSDSSSKERIYYTVEQLYEVVTSV